MNSGFRPALMLLFFCLAAALPAGGKKDKSQAEPGTATVPGTDDVPETTFVQVTGRVRLVGSSSMSSLVITGPDREWYVAREDQPKLKDLQHRTVTVEGDETVRELRFASGMSAGEHRTLKNIRIISIE